MKWHNNPACYVNTASKESRRDKITVGAPESLMEHRTTPPTGFSVVECPTGKGAHNGGVVESAGGRSIADFAFPIRKRSRAAIASPDPCGPAPQPCTPS